MIGDYVRMPVDTWPLPRGSFNKVFWAQPVDGGEMVEFFPVDPRLMREEGELKCFGFAPALGYFLEQGPMITYHLELSPAELEALKRKLYERWGLAWDQEKRREYEQWKQGIQLNALSRLAKAIEGVEVPHLKLDMEMHGDRIVYVVASLKA